MSEDNKDIIQEVTSEEYKWGFVTNIDTEIIPKGLNEEVIRLISAKKGRARMAARLPLEGLREMAADGRSPIGAPGV